MQTELFTDYTHVNHWVAYFGVDVYWLIRDMAYIPTGCVHVLPKNVFLYPQTLQISDSNNLGFIGDPFAQFTMGIGNFQGVIFERGANLGKFAIQITN